MPRHTTNTIPDLGNPDDFARYSKRQWERLDGFYGFWVERWRRVIDFIRSQHWRTLQEIDEKNIPKWKQYPIIDMVLASYIDYMTQWLQSDVRFSAMPASPSHDDIVASNLAEGVLSYLWDSLEMDINRIELGAWLLATGNGALRVYWDTNTGNLLPLAKEENGELIPVYPDGSPLPPGIDPIMLDAGEINVEPVSPQMVRWITGGRKVKGVMVGFLLDYDEVTERYGRDKADTLGYSTDWVGVSLDLMDIHAPSLDLMKTDRALVIEHYLPASYRHPEGLWWTTSDTNVIVPPYPLPAGKVPIVPFRWAPLPGHPTMGMTPLYSMSHTNKLYDRVLAKQLEWMEKIVPKTLLKSGGGVKPGDFNKEPGQEIPVHSGAEPDFLSPPEMPATYRETREEIKDAHSYVGLYQFNNEKEPLPGQVEKRLRLPSRVGRQGEQTQLAVINSRASWKQMGEVLLAYVGRFYTEPRAIQIIGPDRAYQWKEFTGTDLRNLEATIKVDEISLYPWAKQEIRDAVIAVLSTDAGQILFADKTGQLDMGKVSKAMQATGLEAAFDTLDEDILEARNEHSLFENLPEETETPPIQPWNDHSTHVSEHTSLAKSRIFKAWPQHAQKALLDHMGQHEEQLNKAQEAQQQAQLEMEQSLRSIRADTETQAAIKEKLGEETIEMIMGLMRNALGSIGEEPKD